MREILTAQAQAQHEILNYLSPFTYDGLNNIPAAKVRHKTQDEGRMTPGAGATC